MLRTRKSQSILRGLRGLSADGSPDIWLKVHCLKSIDYHLLCRRLVAGHSFRGHEIAEQVEEV